MKKIAIVLLLAVAFCFAMGPLAQAQEPRAFTPRLAVRILPNSYQGVSLPIWQWLQPGTNKAVIWEDWQANPRFAIYDITPSNPEDPSNDVVLDKETGLVWARDARGMNPNFRVLYSTALLNVYSLTFKGGWRLPTIHELLSLLDSGDILGSPFINADDMGDGWWSSTTYELDNDQVWIMTLVDPLQEAKHVLKTSGPRFAWYVRGGN